MPKARKGGTVDVSALQENTLQPFTCTERVKVWVKHTQEFHQRNIEENAGTGKRKRHQSVDDFVSSDVEDDPDKYSDDLMIWEKQQTESRKKYRWNSLPLHLKCEWFGCSYEDTSVEGFVKHVSFHIPEVEIKTDVEDNDIFACQWEECQFESRNDKEFVRHVNYHSYHTKLKCIGSKMLELLNIPNCTANPSKRNCVPSLPAELSCEWEECSRVFNNSQMFFYHVASHMASYQNLSSMGRTRNIPCGWSGCSGKFYNYHKLADHVKHHTHEKLTACPGCGSPFSSPTKLNDHCVGQVQNKLELRCTSCFKYFASERLLRDHMRRHVSRYKCTFCDMTCPSPSSLSLHIRYKHLNSKPFKCCYCNFSAKTQRDINSHFTTHIAEAIFTCSYEDCTFSCRTVTTLNKHAQDVHLGGPSRMYCCHICNDCFCNGAQLTKHLFKFHKFQWTSGHSRFTYTRNEDGFFRLKPFRLETLEVTQEILQAEMDEHPASISEVCGSHYSVRQVTRMGDASRSQGKTVVISIDEIDKTGDVVRSQVIETEEVPVQKKGGAVVYNYFDGDSLNNATDESKTAERP